MKPNAPQRAGPPSPEDFQRQFAEFMRQQFQPGSGGRTASAPAESGAGEPEDNDQPGADEFEFAYKPREIKEYLDRFVIRQEDAKKVLSVAFCDHYHHVRLALERKETPNYAKQNIILLGP